MPAGKVIAIEGASAAGKTTVAEAAARATGGTALPEAWRRLTPTPRLEFASDAELLALEERLLDEDARRYTEARRRAADGETVIADTGFLGPLTYTWGLTQLGAASNTVLDSLVGKARMLALRGAWGLAEAYVYLDTPAEVRSTRTRADPGGPSAELARRHRDVGEQERAFYGERFAALVGPRFHSVSGEGTAPDVTRRVVDAVRTSVASPPPVGLTDAVLELFEDPKQPARRARGNR
ncbi:MAG: AAA family ATPase [Thermoplasmata archaeon]